MWSLEADYYTKEFHTREELLDDIMQSGMDPSYMITHDGLPTGETAWDLIEPQL